MSPSQRPLAITLGDPAGIGPEIIAKAFRDAPEVTAGCFVAGDLTHLRRGAQVIAAPGVLALPLAVIENPADAVTVPPRCIPLLQVGAAQPLVAWGRVDAIAGKMAAAAVVWAAQAALRGDIAGLITAPLNKEALAAAGVAYPGHTELLQAQAAAFAGTTPAAMPARMMLANTSCGNASSW